MRVRLDMGACLTTATVGLDRLLATESLEFSRLLLRRIVEFQWFLTALSVRPESSFRGESGTGMRIETANPQN